MACQQKILPSRANTLYAVIGQTLYQADIKSLGFSQCGRGNIVLGRSDVLPRSGVISTALLYTSALLYTNIYHIRWLYTIHQSSEMRLRIDLPIQICVVDPSIAETKAKPLCLIIISWWQKMLLGKCVLFQPQKLSFT